MALGGVLVTGFAAPALGIVHLDPKHEPFSITKAQTGIATSVGSIEFRAPEEGDDTTQGGLRRSGQASGVLLDAGNDRTWFVTAAHNLAPIGRFDSGDGSFQGVVTYALGDNYNTNLAVNISEWYISSFAGDGTGISGGDIAIVPLPFTPAEVAATGNARVPIFTRDTPQEFIDAIEGEIVEIVGFGQSGNGAQGAPLDDGDPVPLTFDGVRRWGQNRLELWTDNSIPRIFADERDNFVQMDFDVDRDDDLYDVTPNDPTDINAAREQTYALKNTGEFVISGGIEPRQIPEEDFRVPFEVGFSPGDSGGGVFLSDALVGLPISVRAVPLDGDGDADEDGVGFGYGSTAEFITLNDFAFNINTLITAAEQAEVDFANGARADPLLDDTELASMGWLYGAVDLNPIYNYPDQDEINNRRGNAVPPGPITSPLTGGDEDVSASTIGAEVLLNILEVSYYAGEQLSNVSKAKLIGILPVTASDDITDQELIDLINLPDITDSESLVSALDNDLGLFYDAPTIDRAIHASSTLRFIATNTDAGPRASSPTIDLDLIGDYDGDGGFDTDDIDAFIAEVAAGSEWADLDLDGDFDDDDTSAYVEGILGLLMGDANLSGQIEQGDLDAVLANWGQSGKGWADGSFGTDGFVDQADLDIILQNWGSTAAPSFAANPGVVPEPSSVAALAAIGAVALRRRRSA